METRYARLNLIIGLIYPFRKKGQSEKKILFNILQVYGFSFLQLPTSISHVYTV